jgi:hypothetical protein
MPNIPCPISRLGKCEEQNGVSRGWLPCFCGNQASICLIDGSQPLKSWSAAFQWISLLNQQSSIWLSLSGRTEIWLFPQIVTFERDGNLLNRLRTCHVKSQIVENAESRLGCRACVIAFPFEVQFCPFRGELQAWWSSQFPARAFVSSTSSICWILTLSRFRYRQTQIGTEIDHWKGCDNISAFVGSGGSNSHFPSCPAAAGYRKSLYTNSERSRTTMLWAITAIIFPKRKEFLCQFRQTPTKRSNPPQFTDDRWSGSIVIRQAERNELLFCN